MKAQCLKCLFFSNQLLFICFSFMFETFVFDNKHYETLSFHCVQIWEHNASKRVFENARCEELTFRYVRTFHSIYVFNQV